jgi:hypothetical protein
MRCEELPYEERTDHNDADDEGHNVVRASPNVLRHVRIY